MDAMATKKPDRSADDTARGKRIREAYTRAGYSRQEVANALGTYYADVDRIEKGQRIEPERLTRIAELCGVTERWLVRGPVYSEEFSAWLTTQAPADLHELERELLGAINFPPDVHPGPDWYGAALHAWRAATRGALRDSATHIRRRARNA